MAEVKISEIIHDLKNGYVRYKRQDKAKTGSIQEKYDLSDADMSVLVQHAKIKGIKTSKASTIVIVDDTDTIPQVVEQVSKDIIIKKTPTLGDNKIIEPIM